MSTARRRTRAAALEEADRFKALLAPAVTCERFEFAGSIRRQKPDVGDVDIVAIAKWGDLPGDDMFATVSKVNLLWRRIDDLLKLRTFSKHIRDTVNGPRTNWGDSSRSIEFQGGCYDVNLAVETNWGVVLAIRTGPGELSKHLVSEHGMKRYGYRCGTFEGRGFHVFDAKQDPPVMIPMLREETFFGITGTTCKAPELR